MGYLEDKFENWSVIKMDVQIPDTFGIQIPTVHSNNGHVRYIQIQWDLNIELVSVLKWSKKVLWLSSSLFRSWLD